MAQGLMQYAAARQGRRDPRPSEIPSLDIYRRAKSFAQTDPVEAGLIGASMLPVPVVSDVAGFAGDVLGMIKRPEDRTATNAGMAALGLLPFVPALGATIRAYHGSPHNFDKFSVDKIGTGEGTQAYGHGLYFAESPDVARDYQTQLSTFDVMVNGQPVEFGGRTPVGRKTLSNKLGLDMSPGGEMDEAYIAMHDAIVSRKPLLETFDGSTDAYLKGLDADIAGATGAEFKKRTQAFRDEEAKRLSAMRQKLVDANISVGEPKGKYYEVDIDANPEDFFQYDAPIKDQPKAVSKALREIERLGLPGADIIASMRANPKARGGDVVARAKISGRAFFDELKARGVPGIRYKDAMSRGKGDGTYNYVVFDENLLEIKNKK
ncbi:MAG: hypothetical protein VW547_14405 [Alphaproteobacteria bacterium]